VKACVAARREIMAEMKCLYQLSVMVIWLKAGVAKMKINKCQKIISG
jgi:hypothetical protein